MTNPFTRHTGPVLRHNINLLTLLLLVIMLVVLTSPLRTSAQAETLTADYDAEVATAWFDLQLKLVRETGGFTPPVAARAFAYTGVTLYEAVVPGMPEYQSMVGQLNDLQVVPQPETNAAYHWPSVANSALDSITRALFPTATEENQAAIDTLNRAFGQQFLAEMDTSTYERSVTYGRAVANAIFDWSVSDGGHEGYLTNFPADYVPPVGDGLWIPTPRLNGDPQPALQPYWGENRTFVLAASDQCAITEPLAYSTEVDSNFYIEALEVYKVTTNLSSEKAEIAEFWADDPGQTATPPGHSISVTTQVLRQEAARLDLAAEAYARIGIAVADAFIGCWSNKYVHNLLRPVTYIQEVFDAEWMPLLNTPPFPEYPSGHSVQSGATAAVLTTLFGENYAFTDHTHDDRGFTPRNFSSFAEMAEEAAMSRLYGGIHYRAAIVDGIAQGECIGEQVNALTFKRTA